MNQNCIPAILSSENQSLSQWLIMWQIYFSFRQIDCNYLMQNIHKKHQLRWLFRNSMHQNHERSCLLFILSFLKICPVFFQKENLLKYLEPSGLPPVFKLLFSLKQLCVSYWSIVFQKSHISFGNFLSELAIFIVYLCFVLICLQPISKTP